ncbi:MAG: hypothetical protein EZS28_008481 [Streblomastix strix]|uniref:Uncharacterized protein n=1 Tax=Streblomastix strix TaxID=222440 RepID=A0A5J4WLY8_9EUKA|nr:MAG: hypothetical protein EZS28_008481 [Streblomastix strix]
MSLINFQIEPLKQHWEKPKPPLATNPRNGKLVDQVPSSFSILNPTLIISNLLNLASIIQLIEFVGFFSVASLPSILTILTLYGSQALPSVFNRQIRSGFSGGIIQQARGVFVQVLDLFKYTTFRSCKKSQVHNYKYREAQLRVNTGNELNIGFNQLKSSTPAIVISNGNFKLKELAAKAEIGISKKIPQCLLPLTIDSNDDTLTEFLVYLSDNEFAAITAYSLAQIDVSHSFILSLQIAIHQNGPQAVEQPIHSLITSQGLIGNSLSSAPTAIVRTHSAYGSFNPLKFTLPLANSAVVAAATAALLSYYANLSAGIVIYQLTLHDYAIEQVVLPFAPNGALVYLYPSLVSQDTDIQSECQTRANFYIQSLAEKLILKTKLNSIWDFSRLKNFGSKILGGIKKVAGWVAPTLHKVMGTPSGPVSMLHPRIGGVMNTVGNIAGGIDRHLNKR